MRGSGNHHTIFGARLFCQHLVEIGGCRPVAARSQHAEPSLVTHFRMWMRKHRGASDSVFNCRLSRPIRARARARPMTAAKTKTPDAWPPGRGSTSVDDIRRRGRSAGPARRGTCRLPGSLLLLDARHDQGLEGDRAAVGAAVFNLLLVAIFLRSHLAGEPFASVDADSRASQGLTVFLVARRVLPIALHPIISGIVGDRQNVVDKTVRLRFTRADVLVAKILVSFRR